MRDRTRFVGRSEELSRARAAIATASVVTLHGPPGAGKSRLARLLARELGARFVALDDVADEAGLLARIAGAPASDLARGVAAVVDALPEDTLLVLDPFEHLVEPARPLLIALLDAAPGLRVLVGSRERTRVPGEVVVPIGPLVEDDAIELFLDRARAIAPARALPRADVAELVARVDRLPLAIELVAARSVVLSPREQLSRETTGLLSAATDASLALLGERQRTTWTALSVFRGGFTLAAAEAITGATAEVLDDLVAHALVEARDTAEGTRFELLSTLRNEAAHRLVDATNYYTRHSDYYAAHPAPVERENLLVAFEHASDPSRLVTLAVALDPLLVTEGPFELHRRVLDSALAVQDHAKAELRAALLRAHARFLGLRGRHGEAHEINQRAREFCRESGDARGEAWCDAMMAFTARALGRPHEALAAGERAREGARRFHDRTLEALAEQTIAFAEYALGDPLAAYQRTRHAAAIARAAGSSRMLGITMANAARFARDLGRLEEARACCDESAEAVERARDRVHAAKLAPLRGAIAADEHHLDEAEALLLRAIAELSALGDAQYEAEARLELARIGFARGDLRFAQRALDDAREAVQRADDVELRLRTAILASRLDGHATLDEVIDECERRGLLTLAREAMSEHARVVGPENVRALSVARDGHAFTFGHRRSELGRRGAAKRILLALVDRRLRAPGEGMTVAEVFAEGWPGERAIGTSGHARVYMAIRDLRALGLEGALVTRDDGYLLDPNLVVSRADDI